MIIIRAIMLLLHFTVIPAVVGRLITYRADNEIHRNPIVVYMTGLFGSWGIFYVLFAIIEWHQNWNTFTDPYLGCFSKLANAYSVVIAVIVIAVLIIDRKNIVNTVKNISNRFKDINLKNYKVTLKEKKYTCLYGIIFAGLMLTQMYFAYGYEINEWSYDDYDYVVTSLDNLSSDSINYTNMITGDIPYTLEKRSAASWTTYISYLAKTSGFEVTTICHTILPILLLLVAYLVYYYMSKLMFKDAESRLIFLILLATLYVFGLYSHYAVTFRLLCALWQGKGVLAAIVIPFLFTYMVELYRDSVDVRNIVPIALTSIGMCSLTIMSAFIVAAIQLLMWVVVSIRNRRPVNIGYLLAGLVGPVFQMIFYGLIYQLMLDMKNAEYKFFKNRIK